MCCLTPSQAHCSMRYCSKQVAVAQAGVPQSEMMVDSQSRRRFFNPNSRKENLENFWAVFICVCPINHILLLVGT